VTRATRSTNQRYVGGEAPPAESAGTVWEALSHCAADANSSISAAATTPESFSARIAPVPQR